MGTSYVQRKDIIETKGEASICGIVAGICVFCVSGAVYMRKKVLYSVINL